MEQFLQTQVNTDIKNLKTFENVSSSQNQNFNNSDNPQSIEEIWNKYDPEFNQFSSKGS